MDILLQTLFFTWHVQVCIGHAESMGAILLSAGEPGFRWAMPNAHIMVHQPTHSMSGKTTDISIKAARAEGCARNLTEILSKHTGQVGACLQGCLQSHSCSMCYVTALHALSYIMNNTHIVGFRYFPFFTSLDPSMGANDQCRIVCNHTDSRFLVVGLRAIQWMILNTHARISSYLNWEFEVRMLQRIAKRLCLVAIGICLEARLWALLVNTYVTQTARSLPNFQEPLKSEILVVHVWSISDGLSWKLPIAHFSNIWGLTFLVGSCWFWVVQSFETMAAAVKEDNHMSAEQAKAFGIVDAIGSPLSRTNPPVISGNGEIDGNTEH